MILILAGVQYSTQASATQETPFASHGSGPTQKFIFMLRRATPQRRCGQEDNISHVCFIAWLHNTVDTKPTKLSRPNTRTAALPATCAFKAVWVVLAKIARVINIYSIEGEIEIVAGADFVSLRLLQPVGSRRHAPHSLYGGPLNRKITAYSCTTGLASATVGPFIIILPQPQPLFTARHLNQNGRQKLTPRLSV